MRTRFGIKNLDGDSVERYTTVALDGFSLTIAVVYQ
jgi:hypothetical protein